MTALRARYAIGNALTLATLGCGADPLEGEQVAEARSAVSALCANSTSQYYPNDVFGAVILENSSTHFCWLTEFFGYKSESDQDGNGGGGLYIGADGYWYLDNQSAAMATEARCVARSCFTGDGVDDVVWVSNHGFGASANSTGSQISQTNYTGWWGDAASALQWFPGSGATNGKGESVQVLQASDPFAASGIRASDGHDEYPRRPIYGHATSLFVGTPNSGQPARFTGSDFVVGGTSTLPLGVRSDEAICFFTKIAGHFRGTTNAGDYVRLYQAWVGGNMVWHARSNQVWGESIQAKGKCFYFHQWDK